VGRQALAPLTCCVTSVTVTLSFYSQPEVEDEYLSPEVRMHIAFKVVSQLEKAKVFRSLLLKELSLRVFLVEQIRSLQLIVEVQLQVIVEVQDYAPSLSQEPSQPEMDDECLRRFYCILPSK
jgi:hypothetical protein